MKMRSLIFLCYLTVALSVEIRFEPKPIGFIFKNKSHISNIKRYETVEFQLNTEILKNRTKMLETNAKALTQLCLKRQEVIDCNVLENFLNNKLAKLEDNDSFIMM